MIERKIQLVGKRSYSISLPKNWVVTNKLECHDTIFLEQNNDNSITIFTKKTPIVQNTRFAISEIPNINHFLAFCYQKNLQQITLYGEITEQKRKSVKKMLHNLDGYEIITEDDKEITIAFLFKDVMITVKKIIMRKIYLLKLMVASLANKDEKNILENENAIDRLYYLGQRTLFECTYNDEARKKNGIKKTEDIFFNLHILKKLEQTGDVIESIKKPVETEKINICLSFLEKIFIKEKEPSSIEKEFKRKKLTSKDILVDRVITLTNDIILNAISIEYDNKFFN